MHHRIPAPATARLAACVAVALCASAHAAEPASPRQDEARKGEARTLDTLVVTAVAPGAPLTWTTDPKLPRQPVPASDGADYLKTIPGFSVIRNGGTNGDPVLRGMFGSRLNVVDNGGTLAGACPARMDNPLSYIAPQTYDRLVIVKGPQSVRWGPGASAGTVRFERDTPHFDTPTLELDASVLAGSRKRNDQSLNLTAGSALGYVRVDGNRSESGDYKDGNGEVVPSKWRKWNGDVAVGWTPDADTVLEFGVNRGNALARYAGRSMDGAAFERTGYGLRFEKTHLSDTWTSLQANAYYNDADHVMDNYTLRMPNPASSMPMPMPMAVEVDRRTRGGRASSEWEWGDIAAVVGVDWQDSRHRGRSAMGRNAYKLRQRVEDADFHTAGVFSELTFGHDQPSRWVAGLRLDRARSTDRRATTTNAMMMKVANPTAGATRAEHLGSAFFRHERDLAGGWTWYAGMGHSERMPDYWELFSPDAGPMGSVNAFASIEPEKTTQLDIGTQFRSATLDAWVSAYAGKVRDYILFTYTRGGMMGDSTRAANVDARIAGGEAGIEWRPTANWKLGSTLAYAWGENRTQHRALAQMPPLDARFTLDHEGAHWFGGALLRAVVRQGRVTEGQGNVVGRDLGPSAGFATLALNGGYRFNAALKLTAGVDNLFDKAYAEHLNLSGSADFGWPADPVRINESGRSMWLRLDYHY